MRNYSAYTGKHIFYSPLRSHPSVSCGLPSFAANLTQIVRRCLSVSCLSFPLRWRRRRLLLLLTPLRIAPSAKAIVDFLLADPDDPALWEGILHPPPPAAHGTPSSSYYGTPSSVSLGGRHGRPNNNNNDDEGEGEGQEAMYLFSSSSSSYWRALLLDGAIRACAPATGERCLLSALRAVGSGDDDGAVRTSGGGGGDGSWEGFSSGWGVGEGEDSLRSLAPTAAVVLRGLYRLARSARCSSSGKCRGVRLTAFRRHFFVSFLVFLGRLVTRKGVWTRLLLKNGSTLNRKYVFLPFSLCASTPPVSLPVSKDFGRMRGCVLHRVPEIAATHDRER